MIIQTHSTSKKINQETEAVVFQPQEKSWRQLAYKNYILQRQEIDPSFLYSATKKVSLIQFDMLEEIDLIYLLGLRFKNRLDIISTDAFIQAYYNYTFKKDYSALPVLLKNIFEGCEAKGIEFIVSKHELKSFVLKHQHISADLFQVIISVCDTLNIPRVKAVTNYTLMVPSLSSIKLYVNNIDVIAESLFNLNIKKL